MISDPIAQIHSIECESEAECLADEVEKLSYVVALLAVAVSCIGVAGGGDDLEAESRDACRRLALKINETSKDQLKGAIYPFQ